MPNSNFAVNDVSKTSLPDGSFPVGLGGKSGEGIAAELHGKFYTANYRGILFSANVTAVTVPVVANNLVSVFSLFNPGGSGVNLELIDFDMAQVLATTVVDAIGLYGQAGPVVAKGTFTTPGVAGTNVFGGKASSGGVSPQGQFMSAFTHSGTPVRIRLLGTYGAVTNANAVGPHYDFDGKVILPPNSVVSVAMSTAAGTTSGLDLGITWAEFPV